MTEPNPEPPMNKDPGEGSASASNNDEPRETISCDEFNHASWQLIQDLRRMRPEVPPPPVIIRMKICEAIVFKDTHKNASGTHRKFCKIHKKFVYKLPIPAGHSHEESLVAAVAENIIKKRKTTKRQLIDKVLLNVIRKTKNLDEVIACYEMFKNLSIESTVLSYSYKHVRPKRRH